MTKIHDKIAQIPTIFNIATLSKALWITGNSKTGLSWDQPAVKSCPGMTKACLETLPLANGQPGKMVTCYAQQGLYAWGQPKYERNMILIQLALKAGMSYDSIADSIYLSIMGKIKADKKLIAKNIKVIRFNGSGDLYSVAYIKIMIALARLLATKGMSLYHCSQLASGISPV